MIGVLHAYSRANAGDGLLVDLTLDRLRRIGVGVAEVLLVALDADSFPEIPRRERLGARGRGLAWELVPATSRAVGLYGSALAGRPMGRVARAMARCGGFVGVGGGYLRAADAISSIGTLLNHLPQLALAGKSEAPAVYLPQSVGPLRGPVGKEVRRALRRVGLICVRDGWSERELAGLPGVRRIPDLAVLDIAECWDSTERLSGAGRVALVARRVGHAAGYEAQLQRVAARLGDGAVWAVQAGGTRSKSDAVHYEHRGLQPQGDLADLLAAGGLSAVISVRLHGALMALKAGVPAIHLAYDRKGPAAFADLDLDGWCFDVRSLDIEALTAAVDGILADPSAYWGRAAARVPALQRASAALDRLIAASLT